MTTMTKGVSPTYVEDLKRHLRRLKEAHEKMRLAQYLLVSSAATWEAARNAPSQQMYDQKDWDEYSCEPKRRIEDLPCTCNDEQFENHARTGQGYSDTCPYHTEWAKERRRVERGL
jgi:hypothetical protein